MRTDAFNRAARCKMGERHRLRSTGTHRRRTRSAFSSTICLAAPNFRPMHHNTQPHRAALAYARSRGSSSACDKTNASMMNAMPIAGANNRMSTPSRSSTQFKCDAVPEQEARAGKAASTVRLSWQFGGDCFPMTSTMQRNRQARDGARK